MEKEAITKDMTILDAVQAHPEIVEVLMKHGFHCIGCHAAQFESIEQGAIVHGIGVEELMKDLNKAVKEAKEKPKTEEKENETKSDN